MIIAIMIHEVPSYYNVIDEVGTNLEKLQQEFGSWMSNIEGNHPFRKYTEFVERDGEISFADYVNVYGPDDFISWINVDKYNDKVAVRVKNTGDIVPEATIHF